MGFSHRALKGTLPKEAYGLVLFADPKTRHLVDSPDRFGLPVHESLLSLADELPAITVLAQETLRSFSRLLGRERIVALLDGDRQPPRGKQANPSENKRRLDAYDAEIAASVPKHLAAMSAAKKIAPPGYRESVARSIRILVAKRKKTEERTSLLCAVKTDL